MTASTIARTLASSAAHAVALQSFAPSSWRHIFAHSAGTMPSIGSAAASSAASVAGQRPRCAPCRASKTEARVPAPGAEGDGPGPSVALVGAESCWPRSVPEVAQRKVVDGSLHVSAATHFRVSIGGGWASGDHSKSPEVLARPRMNFTFQPVIA